MKDEKRPPNFQVLGQGFYIVRTQAGFRKAVRHYNDGENPRKGELYGFPKSYPSFVSFSQGYQGYHYIQARCMHLNRLSEALQKNEEAFRQFQKGNS